MTDTIEVPAATAETTNAQRESNRRYAKAERTLRERHQVEFDEILDAIYAEDGEVRKRRLTAEERAAADREAAKARAKAKIEALRLQFPDL